MIPGNKKGADSSMGPLIGLIVILIVAALVIFFVAGGFDKVGGWFKQAPDSLAAAVIACQNVKIPTTFCEQMRYVEINGEAQYVNCKYSPLYSQLELTSDIECNIPTGYTEWGNYFCNGLFKKGEVKSDTKANGVLCSSLTCAGLNGDSIDAGASCTSNTKTKKLTKGFAGSDLKACCI